MSGLPKSMKVIILLVVALFSVNFVSAAQVCYIPHAVVVNYGGTSYQEMYDSAFVNTDTGNAADYEFKTKSGEDSCSVTPRNLPEKDVPTIGSSFILGGSYTEDTLITGYIVSSVVDLRVLGYKDKNNDGSFTFYLREYNPTTNTIVGTIGNVSYGTINDENTEYSVAIPITANYVVSAGNTLMLQVYSSNNACPDGDYEHKFKIDKPGGGADTTFLNTYCDSFASGYTDYTAMVLTETPIILETNLITPTNDFAILKNNSFSMSCNVTNSGTPTVSGVNLIARYTNGSVLPTSSGPLTLNESGTYSCGSLTASNTCSHTWNVSANSFANNVEIECYMNSSLKSQSSVDNFNVDIFDAPSDISISLDKQNYSGGQSITATLSSSFTNSFYNVIWRDSNGTILCNLNGTTSLIANDVFFRSCNIPSLIPDQVNNTVEFYLYNTPSINQTALFNTATIQPLEYSITNILLKYDETFLGYSQSIKGTVKDNESEYAVGECCRLQIDDAITFAPIFTSDVVVIDGLGSCETHWTLDKNDFVAPKSYSAMMIAWQCSDPSIPSAQRKRGFGTTSFDVVKYVSEEDALVPVTNKDLTAGFDNILLPQERTNNFGHPVETTTTYWFSNIDTEADYHYEYLQGELGTVNVGTSTKTHNIPVPQDLPTGEYRVEMNIFYSYQGEIKEFAFVKSESFNITSLRDTVEVNNIQIKDYFGEVVTTSLVANDSGTLPDSNYTNPHIMLSEGFGYQICGDITNDYEETIYFHLENIVMHNPTTGQSFSIFDTQSGETWKRPIDSGVTNICWNEVLPLTIETHSDWTFSFGFGIGEESEVFDCTQGTFPLTDECSFAGLTPYFYAGAIEDMIVFDKWYSEPNATSLGQPLTYIVTEREEYMSMNDDCEYKSQDEVDWDNASATCYDKNDGVTPKLTDYSKYPIAGEKFKVCYQIKNYFSDEIALELYDLYMDDDSGETVVYFQNEETENYVPSITDDKVYLATEPSRADEQQGILIDGYSNMCSKWIDLPSDIKGGNDWDIQGKVRIDQNVYDLDQAVTWRWESDEFPIYGLAEDKTHYVSVNTLTDASSYKIGDELYVCANVSSTYPEQLDLEVLYNYRCSATQQDYDLDRNLYGEWTEQRGISASGTQNQCHKFVIPDDAYIKSQGSLYCYASSSVRVPELDEVISSSSPYFTVSKHTPTLNLTEITGTNNIYVDSNLQLNITLENPLVYKQETLTAHYSVELQSDESLIYVYVDELEWEVNESSRNFLINIPHRDAVEYQGDKRNWDLGSGWIQEKRDSFLRKLTGGDQDINIILNYHIHPAYSGGEILTEVSSFQEVFTNFTFKKSGYTRKTVLNDGPISGSNYSTTLYLNEDGLLDYYVYFNLTSVSGPDGTYSTAERENWVVIEDDPDSTVRCYNVDDYSYLNNASQSNEYWIKLTCPYEDSQEMIGKTVKMYRQGQFSASAYVYDPVTIALPVTVNNVTLPYGSNFSGGDIVYVTYNITGLVNRDFEIQSFLENGLGLQIYEWDTSIGEYHSNEGNSVFTFPYLLPTKIVDTPYTGETYELETYLINLRTGKKELTEGVEITVNPYTAIISENITSSTIDNINPVTIDYEINVPTKSMDFYPNLNQPFRIKYHFVNDGGQSISQFTTIDGQYAPLEAYAMFPAGTTQNFSVILRPTNLVAGNYTIVEEIQIDPPVGGVAVWETVGNGNVGTIEVTETLTGSPLGIVETIKENYNLNVEINQTTYQTLNTVEFINSTTVSINGTLVDLDFYIKNNLATTISEVYNILTSIGVRENTIFYFTNQTSEINASWYNSSYSIPNGEKEGITVTSTDDEETLVASFLSPIIESNFTVAQGVREGYLMAQVDSSNKDTRLRMRVYRTNITGGEKAIIRTSELSSFVQEYEATYILYFLGDEQTITTDTRILTEVWTINEQSGESELTLYVDDDSFSRLQVPNPFIEVSVNAVVNFTDVNNNLQEVFNDLTVLEEAINYSQDIQKESVFLVTDSVVATNNALMSNNEKAIEEEMTRVISNLNKFKTLNSEEENSALPTWILTIGISLIGGIIVIGIFMVSTKRKKSETTISSDRTVVNIFDKKQNEVIKNE